MKPMNMLREIRILAVIAGALTDNFCTVIVAVFYGIFAAVVDSFVESPVWDVQNISSNPVHQGSLLIVGLIYTSVGGYVAARLAKRGHLLNGACVGLAGIVVMLAARYFDWSDDDTSIWYEICAYGLVVPAGTVGGYLALKEDSAGASVPTEAMNVSLDEQA